MNEEKMKKIEERINNMSKDEMDKMLSFSDILLELMGDDLPGSKMMKYRSKTQKVEATIMEKMISDLEKYEKEAAEFGDILEQFYNIISDFGKEKLGM